MIDTSVIVPCHGRLASLRRAVESLLVARAAFSGRTELIFVDDASPTPVETALGEMLHEPDIRVIRLPVNRGPSAARNAGIAAAQGDGVLFTDDDVVVDQRWIRELSVYLRDAPRQVAGVGGRVYALGKDIFSQYYEYHRILDPFRLDDGTILYVVTCNCAYRRSVLLSVGGFDEEIRKPGGEDPGLSFKVRAAGYTLQLHDQAVVWHDFRPGLRDFLRTFYRYGRGCRHQVKRHWRG